MYKYYSIKNRKKNLTAIIISVIMAIFFMFISYFSAQTQKQLLLMILSTLLVVVLAYYYLSYVPSKKWKDVLRKPFPELWKDILLKNVEFYVELASDEKEYFENRIQYFLKTKNITGIETEIDDKLKLLIASSAIMPVFAFPEFEYNNINEILIYPESFDEEYYSGQDKKILGMVGNGAMNRMMILSKKDILSSFNGKRTTDNVALHEFVHLIDKKDGIIDGLPSILMNKAFVLPWMRELKKEISKIKDRKSDINPYGMTNNSEFLAVASEYFFMSPKRFKKEHPKLFKYFSKIYRNKRFK